MNAIYRLSNQRSYEAAGYVPALLILCVAAASCSVEPRPNDASTRAAGYIVFSDVTEQAGLGDFRHENGAVGKKWYPEMMGSGGGFVDYDGDRWVDVLLLGGGSWEGRPAEHERAIRLYRNNGDGTFSERTAAAGLDDVHAYTLGVAAADYDNDGDEDFIITNLEHDMLFRNDGGVYAEVGNEAGVSGRADWGSSPLFFDADRDGHLDLFVGNYVRWSAETDKWCPEGSPVKMYCLPSDYDGIASRYFHNDGDGTFTDLTGSAGFITGSREVREKALGVVVLDYNDDGWSDLYVATDGEGNLLYRNDGDGTFTERGVLSGVAFSSHGEARAGMGVDAGVIDSTGRVSIIVGNFSEESMSVYRHLRGGLFVDRSAASHLSQPSYLTLTFGLFLFDVDLDGDLDLFAANGHVYRDRLVAQDNITFRQPAQLFRNAGDGTFAEVECDSGVLTQPMIARGAAYGDYDRDGDLDILISENDGPAHLWRNDTKGGNFLRVRLEGRESNRDALGAVIAAEIDDYRMQRRIRTGSSYLSQSEKIATFGLGESTSVDSLIIYWPSGRVERFAGVKANQEVKIVEGGGSLLPVAMHGLENDALAER